VDRDEVQQPVSATEQAHKTRYEK